jgi:hypothetical protein
MSVGAESQELVRKLLSATRSQVIETGSRIAAEYFSQTFAPTLRSDELLSDPFAKTTFVT